MINFENSIIVSAHPDDEILWFSSIIERVNKILFCYLDCKSNPSWSEGRRRSLSEYPMRNISCLGIDEAEVFHAANWCNPLASKFGIKIASQKISIQYKINYYKLKKQLKKRLIGYSNVFTHNPWGEYGNEEHIQVYRVIRELQNTLKFNLWFPNYCSNKSISLMTKYISIFNPQYVTLRTNKTLSKKIKVLYQKNGCWTWYTDWQWLEEETFIRDSENEDTKRNYGKMFPLNIINVCFVNPLEKKKRSLLGFYCNKLKKLIKKILIWSKNLAKI